jgi:hypothetical protein
MERVEVLNFAAHEINSGRIQLMINEFLRTAGEIVRVVTQDFNGGLVVMIFYRARVAAQV